MNSFDIRFHRRLVARVDEILADQVDELASGTAIDFADYRRRCGRIEGLQALKDEAEAVRRDLLGDDEETR